MVNARDLKKIIQYEAIELYHATVQDTDFLLAEALEMDELTPAMKRRYEKVIQKMRDSAEKNYPLFED